MDSGRIDLARKMLGSAADVLAAHGKPSDVISAAGHPDPLELEAQLSGVSVSELLDELVPESNIGGRSSTTDVVMRGRSSTDQVGASDSAASSEVEKQEEAPANGHKPELEETVPHPAETARDNPAKSFGPKVTPGRVPPMDLDAEELVLGAMMLGADHARRLFDIISIEDFYLEEHRTIARAVLELLKNGSPTEARAVFGELPVAARAEIGAHKLVALVGAVPVAASAPYYARRVVELAQQRQILDTATRLAHGIYDGGWDSVRAREILQIELSALPAVRTETEQRPEAVDVVDRAAGREADDDRTDHLIAALWRRSAIVILTGEEGDGKTILAEQLCRELLRGEHPLGFFKLGDIPIGSALFVDTEMEDPEIDARCAEMNARGLELDRGQMFWISTGSLDLAHAGEHRELVESELARLKPDLLWIDSGGNAVDKPKEDESVKPFFNWLSELIRRYDLKGIGLTVHPRKRDQENKGRRFDDLFGSREWKGRSSKALYIEGQRITAWKDRGGGLRRLWPPQPGRRYPQALLGRPGFDDPRARPFALSYRRDDTLEEIKEEAADAETRILDALREKPGAFTRTSIATHVGGNKQTALRVIGGLIERGIVGPATSRAKLRIISDQPDLLSESEPE